MKCKIFIFLFTLALTLSLGNFEQVLAQISGRVIDVNGNAITNDALVELIPAGLKTKPFYNEINSESTDENGAFIFNDIPDGNYVLAINYGWSPNIDCPYPTTFYPGVPVISQAFIFEINLNQKTQNIIFQLPQKLSELTIRGKVLLQNGKPAVDVHVRLHNEEYIPSLPVSDCRTDQNGNFFLKGFVNGKYHIEADNYTLTAEDWNSVSSITFALNRNMKGFRLKLKKR